MANRFVAAASLPLLLSNDLGYVIATKMLVKKHMNKTALLKEGWTLIDVSIYLAVRRVTFRPKPDGYLYTDIL